MKLREMRDRAGLTQRQLSEMSGVNIRNIQQYETGNRRIDGADLEALCDLAIACKCTLFDLLESEELIRKLKIAAYNPDF